MTPTKTPEWSIEKNKLGYFSVSPMPSEEVISKHYRDVYFQKQKGSYQAAYSDAEIKFFTTESIVSEHIVNNFKADHAKTVFDVGAGEGFFSRYFFSCIYCFI